MINLNLEKNQTIVLDEVKKGLTNAKISVGWDFDSFDTIDLDLKARVFFEDGKEEKAYFGNKGICKVGNKYTVQLDRDNLTGEGSGDDENIFIDLEKLGNNFKVKKVLLFVDVFTDNKTFKDVKNWYVRLVDMSTNQELLRYSEGQNSDGKNSRVLNVAELNYENGKWSFTALGDFKQLEEPTKKTGFFSKLFG